MIDAVCVAVARLVFRFTFCAVDLHDWRADGTTLRCRWCKEGVGR